MTVNGKSIKNFSVAMDAMRKPDARLIQTFSYYGKPDYWIAPGGGRVESKIAEQIIAHPQVIGGKDALFPGHHQTWRMRVSDNTQTEMRPTKRGGRQIFMRLWHRT